MSFILGKYLDEFEKNSCKGFVDIKDSSDNIKFQVRLYAPLSYNNQPCWYFNTSIKHKKEVCNGCGPKSSPKILIRFLDHICGIDFTEACNIHDWMYQYGETIEDKSLADNALKYNLSIIINAGNILLRPIRNLIAEEYYQMVHQFGDDSFWDGKFFKS